jgi:ssDNA-binding Zn-finger/Zn-ribbon topoisomerase 1
MPTDTTAPICICGAQMRLRRGENGRFYGCPDYPTCDYTEPLDPYEEQS